ncbi:MAG TPA: hypothetical protein VGQ42_03255 [Candidatus Dormibacteraeota bacterium]|jgi:hypothetical protein|nr:hypothetical protein [Candidatus Dormibacteraeota bacterium]
MKFPILATTATAMGLLAALSAPSLVAAAPTRAGTVSSSVGYDISYPQCPSSTPRNAAFGIAGVTNGLPWSANPCLRSQWSWAAGRPGAAALYVNTANPGPISSHWRLGGPRACADPSSTSDPGCAYDYGWNAAAQAMGVARTALPAGAATSHAWWLDVETGNSWNGSTAANTADLQGYVDYLRAQHVPSVGVYSTGYQWGVITGGAQLGTSVLDWVAGASSQKQAAAMCTTAASFSGGKVTLSQYPANGFDADWRCA